MSVFEVWRDNKMIGEFSIIELRPMVNEYKLRTSDIFKYKDLAEFSFKDMRIILRNLTDDETVIEAADQLLLINRQVICKGKSYPFNTIEKVEVIIPQKPKEKNISKLENIFYWTLAVLFIWTVVVPIAVWQVTRKNYKEEGLGAVYGIKLQGSLGEVMIKDGIGILSYDDPAIVEIKRLYGVIEKARDEAKI
ncbi:MAG: hypothetical protein AAF984_02380 [Verrucomicrobiota bacterium]